MKRTLSSPSWSSNFSVSCSARPKTGELAKYLEGKRKTIDFSYPKAELTRDDSERVRGRILGISYAEWKKAGFSKGTLHELKAKARAQEPFKIYAKVRERLTEEALAD
jgi:CRISP-associated protein Cas1